MNFPDRHLKKDTPQCSPLLTPGHRQPSPDSPARQKTRMTRPEYPALTSMRLNVRNEPHLIRVTQVELIPAPLEDDKPLEVTLYLHKTKVVQPKTEPTTYMKATLEWILPPSSFSLSPPTVILFPIPLTPCG